MFAVFLFVCFLSLRTIGNERLKDLYNRSNSPSPQFRADGPHQPSKYCLTSLVVITRIKVHSSPVADPELIYDKARTGEEGFEGALELFPQNFSLKQLQPDLSGKSVFISLPSRC